MGSGAGSGGGSGGTSAAAAAPIPLATKIAPKPSTCKKRGIFTPALFSSACYDSGRVKCGLRRHAVVARRARRALASLSARASALLEKLPHALNARIGVLFGDRAAKAIAFLQRLPVGRDSRGKLRVQADEFGQHEGETDRDVGNGEASGTQCRLLGNDGIHAAQARKKPLRIVRRDLL